MSSHPISVAFDLSCLIARPLTGVGYYTLHLYRALAELNPAFDLRVVAASAQRPTEALAEACALASRSRVLRCPTRLHHAAWKGLSFPPIECFTGRCDIAHGMFHLTPPARRAKRMTTVYDLSGLRHPEAATGAILETHRALLQHAVAEADCLMAISESCKADLIELLGAPEEKVRVVYGGVAPEDFEGPWDAALFEGVKKKFGIQGDYLIHLGTLEPRKNLPRLLTAYARLREQHADAPQLVLAGGKGWMYEAIFEAIEQHRLQEAVMVTGYLDRTEAIVLLRGALACAYPSLYEGFGLPVLEAMAAKTPVLTSNCSSLPEVIGDTGIQVDPTDIDAITAGLEKLVYDTAFASGCAEAAHARAQGFTWQHSAEALAKVYEALAGRTSA